MAINSKQSKYSVFSLCILSFIHNKNTHNKSSHQIRKKGRKQKTFFETQKFPLIFISVGGILHDEYSGSIYNSQRSKIFHWRGDRVPFRIPLHFMAILAFSSLFSYHTLPTLHSYICIFMDIAHYSYGRLGKPIYEPLRYQGYLFTLH